MKKVILIVTILYALAGNIFIYGQTNIFPSSGNTGIGTTSPSQKLNVKGTVIGFPATTGTVQTYGIYRIESSQTDVVLDFGLNGGTDASSWIQSTYKTNLSLQHKLLLNPNGGNVGIGTTTPDSKLHIQSSGPLLKLETTSATGNNYLLFSNSAEQLGYIGYGSTLNNSLCISNYKNDAIRFFTNSVEYLRITPEGNLLINKTSQINNTYKLDVAGKIRANEIVINTTGADFVFAPTYKLRTLPELEQFVKTNNHLPEIPSATEMQQEGVSVSDMQTKLLQKVEELTLYMIELKKENEQLKSENVIIKTEIDKLKTK